MYRDFFEPPPKTAEKKMKLTPKKGALTATGKVRFHEEVKVKKIKAKGKNPPLSILDDDEEDSEDEDSDDEAYDETPTQQPLIEEKQNINANAEASALSDEDDYSLENLEDLTKETIEHLKDDLFAEEEDVLYRGKVLSKEPNF